MSYIFCPKFGQNTCFPMFYVRIALLYGASACRRDGGRARISHQAPVVLGFLACVSGATSIGKSFRPHVTRIGHRGNPTIISCRDTGPRYPKLVPRDQNFGFKFFLLTSSNDVILCILWICFGKIA